MTEMSYPEQNVPLVNDLQASDNDRADVLKRIIAAFGLAALVCAVVQISLGMVQLVSGQLLIPSVSMAVFTAIVVGVSYRLHQRNPNLAGQLLLFGIVVYMILSIIFIHGVAGPSGFGFLLCVMVAGLVGQARDSVRVFIITMICYAVLTVIQAFGWLQPAESVSPTGDLLLFTTDFLTIVSLGTYVAVLWANLNSKLVSQAREQAEALLRSNEKLMEKSFQQVELGSELSAAAAQLLAASHQQASGATEQASAVSQVSTTIEELGSTARQIAIAAEQVAEAAQQTLENLSEGQDAVDRSIQAMERIRHRVQDVSTRVLSLGERSQQIGEIIDLINDLSDETHLLALNAAIEAAGAGEHGRRFAVVAAEVKSLANRALAAAKEVKGVIAEIQQATNAAVLAAEEGGKEVERGVELAHSAGQVMDSIVMVAERTAQSGAEINLATAQQQSASEQVVETMREVADVARQTAAGARQMAESAQMLTAIAERLHGIVYQPPQTEDEQAYHSEIDNRLRHLSQTNSSSRE
jgi:methyl-accepting chemotaxis protein